MPSESLQENFKITFIIISGSSSPERKPYINKHCRHDDMFNVIDLKIVRRSLWATLARL